MRTKNTMRKIRKIVADSGLTQQVIGVKMGYPEKSARQSVSQFLKTNNPTLELIVRFAEAMGVTVDSLL